MFQIVTSELTLKGTNFDKINHFIYKNGKTHFKSKLSVGTICIGFIRNKTGFGKADHQLILVQIALSSESECTLVRAVSHHQTRPVS